MPNFTSSRGGSNSSGNKGIPILDAEEVGELLKLDSKTVECLKKEPANDDAAILVLSYQNAFVNLGNFDVNKQTVSTALVDLGATIISDNVFMFEHWSTLYAARDNMFLNMRWCFHHTDLDTTQKLNMSQQPMITTTAIYWVLDPGMTCKLSINPLQFFIL